MKLNPLDGYVVEPWIIWGELDFRGRVCMGIKPLGNFTDLSFLNNLKLPCQYLHINNSDFLFISFPLSMFSSKKSLFNLTDKKLKEFYSETLENSQDEIQKTYWQIKNLSGQDIKPLQVEDLAMLWHGHFNPVTEPDSLPEFDAGDSILNNCLPGYTARGRTPGFELNNCIHHYIKVLEYRNLNEIAKALKDQNFSVTVFQNRSELSIHIHGSNAGEISDKSLSVKEALHAVPESDYYEANDIGSNVLLFECTIPGLCFIDGEML